MASLDATSATAATALPDVLRALPPATVRITIWLQLSRADRASLRLVCRDIHDMACGSWVDDLQLLVALSETSPDTSISSSTIAVAALSMAHAQQPTRRTLHQVFSAPHSVTFRLTRASAAEVADIAASEATAGGSGVPAHLIPPPPQYGNVGKNTASGQGTDALLPSQHFSIFRRSIPASAAANTAAAAVAATGGGTAAASPSAASGGGGDGGDGGGFRASRVQMPRGSVGALIWNSLLRGNAEGITGDGSDGSGGGGGLGVCAYVKSVRLLGLPFEFVRHLPYMTRLAAAYPNTETLVLRCTQPSSTSPSQHTDLLPSPHRPGPENTWSYAGGGGGSAGSGGGGRIQAAAAAAALPSLPWSADLWRHGAADVDITAAAAASTALAGAGGDDPWSAAAAAASTAGLAGAGGHDPWSSDAAASAAADGTGTAAAVGSPARATLGYAVWANRSASGSLQAQNCATAQAVGDWPVPSPYHAFTAFQRLRCLDLAVFLPRSRPSTPPVASVLPNSHVSHEVCCLLRQLQQLPLLQCLRLSGIALVSDPSLVGSIAQLSALTELQLRIASGPSPVTATSSCNLPGSLTALRRLQYLSVDLYGRPSARWFDAGSGGSGGGGGGTSSGGGGDHAAAGSPQLTWADFVLACCGSLTHLDIPMVLIDSALLQALQCCPGLSRLSALELAARTYPTHKLLQHQHPQSHQQQQQQQQHVAQLGPHPQQSVPSSSSAGSSSCSGFVSCSPSSCCWLRSLVYLRLADVRLGRGLLEVLRLAPQLRGLALGLRLERFQIPSPQPQLGVATASGGGTSGGGGGGGHDVDADGGDDEDEEYGAAQRHPSADDAAWRPSYEAAAAAGAAVALASAAAAAGTAVQDASAAAAAGVTGGWGAPGGGGGGGGGAWVELLRVCCRCEEVDLALRGALDWPEVVGWLAGALGRRLRCLALQASSPKWEVRETTLAALARGLPYLRRLELLSYDITQPGGLMPLTALRNLAELRLDMQSFMAWMPPDTLMSYALAAARQRGAESYGSSNSFESCGGISAHDGGDRGRGGDSTGSSGIDSCSSSASGVPSLRIVATFLSEQQAADMNAKLRRAVTSGGREGGSGGGGWVEEGKYGGRGDGGGCVPVVVDHEVWEEAEE